MSRTKFDQTEIIQRFNKILLEEGKKVTAFGRETQISQSLISQISNGTAVISVETLFKLCGTKYDLKWLLSGVETMIDPHYQEPVTESSKKLMVISEKHISLLEKSNENLEKTNDKLEKSNRKLEKENEKLKGDNKDLESDLESEKEKTQDRGSVGGDQVSNLSNLSS